ncbi:hypothetical protein I7I50_10583 [Histoplasma capsulatum G186AR]|uniref:Uncharacterized protein n=1 Tax=Ajellomyces capsulatus TaxID=5037 RepID=A0A8H7Z9P3_AJECA|nr:hypothetical protein I7I52_01822 [Histoplasma capsulatum]QSS69329.1 hypothetical protein I7I50_10583 [Histoplasma capsulatum G186AR]
MFEERTCKFVMFVHFLSHQVTHSLFILRPECQGSWCAMSSEYIDMGFGMDGLSWEIWHWKKT